MVKLKEMALKTYGKKKRIHKKENPSIIINTVNVYNITNNFFLTKTSSGSGDEFDKLLKGPICNKSSTRSPTNDRFFKRQATPNLFDSSNVPNETPNSNHLFEDSDSSDFCSMSTLPTPPSYHVVNNKVVRVNKQVSRKKLKPARVVKGRCKRLKSPAHRVRQLHTTSSTPTKPVLKTEWTIFNVSPILPPELATKPIVFHDMSALAEGFGKLGIGSTSKQILAITDGSDNQAKDEENKNLVVEDVSECIRAKTSGRVLDFGIDGLTSTPKSTKKCQSLTKYETVELSADNNNYYTKEKSSSRSLINNNEDWMENSMIKPRLSLQPGKRWKRSFLQQRLEDGRKSSFSSCVSNQRRMTIGPALLAKLVKEASQNNITAPDISQVCNESSNESLTILKLNPAALNTITKRRRYKEFQPLDIVQEEEGHDDTFNFDQSRCDNVISRGRRGSVDIFQEDEYLQQRTQEDTSYLNLSRKNVVKTRRRNSRLDLFNEEENESSSDDDELLCSGVDHLASLDLDCLSPQDIDNEGVCLKETLKLGALAKCGQEIPLLFCDIFPDDVLRNCKKIGEGVFGEVFMLSRSSTEVSVLKVIPVEGSQLVNNEPQKCLDEVLSEIIIAEELSLLCNNPTNYTSGFCKLKDKFCLQGAYPPRLVELWKNFAEESESENDCPDMFGCDQLYIVLELAHAGQPVESFKFDSARQSLSVFLQIVFSLGAAELSLEFEHRDLHIGNILIKETSEKYLSFTLDGYSFQVPTFGMKATIIDYTLSRISFEGDVLFCDLEKDPEMFTAEGDYQFEIYRLMRDDLKNNWRSHAPITNIRWLHYLADKLITKKKYKKSKTIRHKENMEKLKKLKELVLDFKSSLDLSEYLLECYKDTVDLIKT